MATSKSRPFPFSKLSPKIRRLVYQQMTVVDGNDQRTMTKWFANTFWFKFKRMRSILWKLILTCREIYQEALPFLYKGITFRGTTLMYPGLINNQLFKGARIDLIRSVDLQFMWRVTRSSIDVFEETLQQLEMGIRLERLSIRIITHESPDEIPEYASLVKSICTAWVKIKVPKRVMIYEDMEENMRECVKSIRDVTRLCETFPDPKQKQNS
ncbi:Hypothetical protein D9617_4g002240 [Elsinoe fawcettii]|nr:Hypothetical protein D9617_4g002240 [Elsinoe fawcettii]